MAAGLVIFIFAVIFVVLVVGGLVAPRLSSDSMSARRDLREARSDAKLERQRANLATKALRAIANGAGNPVLEAQDALDRIDNTYNDKELN